MANLNKNNLKKIAAGKYELETISDVGYIHIQLGKVKEHRWCWKLNYLNQYAEGEEQTYWQGIEAIGSASIKFEAHAVSTFRKYFIG